MGTLQLKKGWNHTYYSFCLKCFLNPPLLPVSLLLMCYLPQEAFLNPLDSMYSPCTPLVLCTCFCHPLVIDVWPASLIVMGRDSLICL